MTHGSHIPLRDALRLAGYTDRPYSRTANTGRHEIVRRGRVVACLSAHWAWDWLRRRQRKLDALFARRTEVES